MPSVIREHLKLKGIIITQDGQTRVCVDTFCVFAATTPHLASGCLPIGDPYSPVAWRAVRKLGLFLCFLFSIVSSYSTQRRDWEISARHNGRMELQVLRLPFLPPDRTVSGLIFEEMRP